MLSTFHVKPSLLLFYIFLNIHKNLTEKVSLPVSTIDLVGERGSTKAFTMKPSWRWSHRWKCVSLKGINILMSTSLDSCTRTFIHGILHFHTICLKDSFHIFILFCFMLLLLSKFSQLSIILYGALVYRRKDAEQVTSKNYSGRGGVLSI